MKAPLLSLEGIVRRFDRGKVVALAGLDLTIMVGDCVAVTGRSGSGKSCLINIAAGLDYPDAGCVRWRGHKVASRQEWAKLRRKEIGIVFQEFLLLPTLTAVQNVELALMGSGHSIHDQTARALAALERVGLASRAGHLPAELSGGERQRVAIARALVREPLLLFADEPTGNLDSANAQAIASLLLGLQEERGMALVLVTHDQALAARCRRRIELEDGRVLRDEAA